MLNHGVSDSDPIQEILVTGARCHPSGGPQGSAGAWGRN